jgi:hypothetical protein
MKYTLNTYGWSSEFVGKSLTKEQTEQIENLKKARGVENLWEIRFDIDDEMDFDMWDGDLLHVNKILNNETASFELVDENREVVLNFGIEDIKFVDEDIDSYDVFPSENVDVLFSIDESKGGMFSYEIESDVVPTIEDFNYSQTTIDTPEGDWDIIDNIFYLAYIFINDSYSLYWICSSLGTNEFLGSYCYYKFSKCYSCCR